MANENDLNGKVGLDVTDFKAAVADLNRQIRVVESGFKAVAAGMDDWRTTSDGLQSRIDSLNKVTDLQRQKISNLKSEYDKIVESKGKDSKAAQDLEVRINKETASLNKNELELRNSQRALENLGNKSNSAEKEVKQLGDEMEKSAKKSGTLKDSLKNLGSHLGAGIATTAKATTVAIVGLGAAAAGAAVGIFKLSEKASDLGEAQNVVESTFKTSAKAIEQWTNTTANSAGISKTASTQWSGFMGAMLKSSGLTEKSAADMSKKLVQLTGDMSSFYNIGTSDMWEKIRAGISGETEPLKALGINMSVANLEAYALSQGIKKSYKEMSQAEQTTLRYNYLMKVTADAQGDFAKTLGSSFANQVRVAQMNIQSLGMSIGKIFLPAVMNMTKGLNQTMTEINGILDGSIKVVKGSVFGAISEIIVAELQNALDKAGKFMPQVIPVIISSINSLISSIVEALPTLLPTLLQGAIQLLNGLITMIQQNVQPLVGLAISLVTQFATFILQSLPQLLPVAIQIIVALINGLTQTLPQLIPTAIQAIITLADGLISNIGTIVDAGINLILALVQGIVNQLPILIQEGPRIINEFSNAIYAQLPKILKAGIDILLMIINGLIQSIPTLIDNLPQIIMAIVNTITLYNWWNLGSGILDKIKNGLFDQNGNSKLAGVAKKVAENVSTAINNIFKGGLSWGKNLISSIGQGISSMGNFISSSAKSLATKALESIKTVFTGGMDIGKNLIEGIWNGIKNMKTWILDNIGGFAGNILGGFKTAFGIHSPSRVMRDQVGKNISLGIVDGIKDIDFMQELTDIFNNNSDNPARAAELVADKVSKKIQSIKDSTESVVKELNNQLSALNKQEEMALRGVKGNKRYAIKDEYDAKQKTIKDEINLRKEQADKEIAEIKRIGKVSKEELDKEIQGRKDLVNSINSLNEQIKNALKEKYTQEEKAQEDSLKKQLDNLENWKNESEKRIDSVYDAKIKAIEEATNAQIEALQAESDELDRQQKLQDRADKDKEDISKIQGLQSAISYEHNDYNKAQLQKQLEQAIADRNKRLQQEALEDKKAALKEEIDTIKENANFAIEQLKIQKQTEIDNLNKLYTSEKKVLNNRLANSKEFYDKKLSNASLEAEAEKLIMQNNQIEIIALLNSYGEQYKVAGQTLGDRLVEGFQPAIEEIKNMIASITEEISAARDSALGIAQETNTFRSASQDVAEKSIVNNYKVNITSPVAQTPSQQRSTMESTLRKLSFTIG